MQQNAPACMFAQFLVCKYYWYRNFKYFVNSLVFISHILPCPSALALLYSLITTVKNFISMIRTCSRFNHYHLRHFWPSIASRVVIRSSWPCSVTERSGSSTSQRRTSWMLIDISHDLAFRQYVWVSACSWGASSIQCRAPRDWI